MESEPPFDPDKKNTVIYSKNANRARNGGGKEPVGTVGRPLLNGVDPPSTVSQCPGPIPGAAVCARADVNYSAEIIDKLGFL